MKTEFDGVFRIFDIQEQNLLPKIYPHPQVANKAVDKLNKEAGEMRYVLQSGEQS